MSVKTIKKDKCPAKISERAVRSWAMGRLIVTPMLVGPTSSQTLQLILRRQNGSLCDRIVAIVGPRVAHNGEFCGLIYLFDCVHISLVSALSMMNPKK